jgi:hypothetical protein
MLNIFGIARITVLLSCVFLLCSAIGCTSDKSSKEPDAKSTDTTAKSISEQLTARREAFQAKAPAAALEITRDAIEKFKESGALAKALNVGDTIPEFSLEDALGEMVNISDILKKGPVVLVFYRGNW